MTSPSDAPTAVSVATPHATEKLEELTKAASLQYSLKNFSEASDHYANAVEIQVNLNGEMAPENAELHFYYGRALYKVAIAKSDVLGSKVAQKEKKNPKTKSAQSGADVDSSVLANGATKDVQTTEDTTQGKPYFQLTGMENWSDSDEEGEDEEGAQEDAQDDFGDAYEIFEIARVLYEKQLEAIIANGDVKGGKGKAELTPEARAIKEKLADIHYYLVQISFENERFHDAIPDARAALALQEELNPVGHENVTEAHYSLSLALEFASIAKLRDQQAGRDSGASADEATDGEIIDWELRNEAIKHTHLAIQSLELRLEENQKKLSGQDLTSEQKKEAEAIIGDGKAMLEDLKTRFADLKEDPSKQQIDTVDESVFKGILSGLLGADVETQKAKLAEATQSANDISGLVKSKRKEKPVVASSSARDGSSSSKRKLGAEDNGAGGKRAKTEEIQ